KVVTVADQPLDGVDFPPPPAGPTPAAGTILTIAGNGLPGPAGDGGPAVAARLPGPSGLAMDRAGNLYMVDNVANRVRRVDAATGPIGNGKGSFSGDGGPATAAALSNPQGLAFDGAGNLYIADQTNGRVRKVSPDGIITTVAGGGTNALVEGADAVTVTLKL